MTALLGTAGPPLARSALARLALACTLRVMVPAARAQTAHATPLDADPTRPERRATPTTGYGLATRGGQYLNPEGQAGSVQLSGARRLVTGVVRVEPGLAGGKALGVTGYGHTLAGAGTAFHRAPTPAPTFDPLRPENRRARAIRPGATLPTAGPF